MTDDPTLGGILGPLPKMPGVREPIRRHYVEGQPCDGSETCGVDHEVAQDDSDPGTT